MLYCAEAAGAKNIHAALEQSLHADHGQTPLRSGGPNPYFLGADKAAARRPKPMAAQHPQGVRRIRKAAKPPTAAQQVQCGRKEQLPCMRCTLQEDKKFAASDIPLAANWWGKVDSNHRSRRQQIYSLPHLTALEFPHMKFGAGGRIRTPDLLITNQLLYQLSYTSSSNSRIYLSR